MLCNKDIWVQGILPFLGPGHFIFVALVCKQFKKNYLDYFSTLEELPKISNRWRDGQGPKHVSATSTVYLAAFSSVPCANFWNHDTKEDKNRLTSGLENPKEDNQVCCMVAKYGNLEVLKWARRKGFPWDHRPCRIAAQHGHIEVLKYAGCEWDEGTCETAAKFGQIEVLKYLHDHGCPWNETTCRWAAIMGHLEVLKYAHENGCPWTARSMAVACFQGAYYGHLEISKYAWAKGYPWSEETCNIASERGHLNVLQWAHAQAYPWDEQAVRREAEATNQGHILEWLDELNRDA